jgi:hypothetical protein
MGNSTVLQMVMASAVPQATSNSYSYVQSDSYTSGILPYQFHVYSPNGPIPDQLQPYEVWPMIDGNGYPYFYMDVSANSIWGQWTNAQLSVASIAAVSNTGWIISSTSLINLT